MIEFLPYLYDILAVILLLYYIYVSSRRGFAATVVSFIGYVAALTAAWALSKMVAPALFDTFFRSGLVERVHGVLDELPGGMEFAETAASLLAALPAYIGGMLNIGGYNASELSQLLSEYSSNTAELVVDKVFAPAIIGMLTMVLFIVFFSVLMVVVRSLTRFFYSVNRVPLIGPLNSILGGIMGLFTGVVSLYVIIVILQLVLTLTNDSLHFLNRGLLEQTYTYRLFLRLNPFELLNHFGNF
ncbi:CvpA family protein [Hydrogenoanaerobacterium sp.]|uniref:CvpA family protein n=1 Tax=Hydrogenoanaerobacterium sp. TaxID=2953763 RepID=UPI0028A272F5|nr:CvpA family protein [Hydrogenoanaerobacterium sp.]